MQTITIRRELWTFQDPLVNATVAKSVAALSSAFKHLPVPVRIRASGALRAWDLLSERDARVAKARRIVSNPDTSIHDAFVALVDAITPSIVLSKVDRDGAAEDLRRKMSAIMMPLTFWWRGGTLYEPTLSLGTLLSGSDIASDLPAHLLVPPTHTLCIIPPWQHRHYCGGSHAIFLFESASTTAAASTGRVLAMSSFGASEKGSVTAEGFCVTIDNENEPLPPLIDRELDRQCSSVESAWELQKIEESRTLWMQRLDYVTKTLLYLRSDGAELQHLQPYSAAPKEFPGLGRRKREEKLAQVDQLYDRYVVGPVSLEGINTEGHSERLTPGQDLPPHWRRGHFRMQPHGPQSSLRKVIFVAPVIVRADKLVAVD
ncbi:hypothetical protein [Ralstonia pseudosolanacearum]|uniref:Uncharacterized protein n=1 Tax=Ralstonia solanacearum TaxID=305 RepID=A0A0S4X0N1_RALSL|nr:hypothetical protein [Ralstonia sp. RS650]UZF14020.1 hypothetical protein LH706_13400 [Ralstonia solanacearum]UZF29150.1 hypothetical protein LGV82_13405 [Ralstonia sp. RS650]CUV57017.1 conserved protein of unknown function [Ralstonia solanacearum]